MFTPTDPVAFTGSTSTAVSYVVYATATHTALNVDPNPSIAGNPVNLMAHVTPHGAAGTIQFTDGTTPLGDPQPVNPGGIAHLNTSTLSTGNHALTAVFTPTNPVAFGPSTSPPVPLTVRSILR